MATGLYFDLGWVVVDYGTQVIPIPEDEYISKGYKPDVSSLPTKEEYERRNSLEDDNPSP